jgi:hypothetical protein
LDAPSQQVNRPKPTDSEAAWYENPHPVLHVRIDGAGSRSIVLIHELGGSMASWDGVASRLAADARVIRYDQRGQGQSVPPRMPYALADQIADLQGLLDAIAPDEPLWLVAAAAGAAIARWEHAFDAEQFQSYLRSQRETQMTFDPAADRSARSSNPLVTRRSSTK